MAPKSWLWKLKMPNFGRTSIKKVLQDIEKSLGVEVKKMLWLYKSDKVGTYVSRLLSHHLDLKDEPSRGVWKEQAPFRKRNGISNCASNNRPAKSSRAGTLWPNMGVNEFSSDLPLDLTWPGGEKRMHKPLTTEMDSHY